MEEQTMSFNLDDWELIKKHVADLAQVEVEASFAAQLVVQAETLHLLIKKDIASVSEVLQSIAKLEAASAQIKHQSPAVGHFVSLAALQLRNAFDQGKQSKN
jgi:hypothetical protein